MVWIRRDEARRISVRVHVGETAWDGAVRIEAVPFIAGRADWRGRERATRRGHGRRARARGRRRGRRQGATGRAPPPCASDREWPDSAIMSGDGSPVTYVQTKTTLRLVLALPLPAPRFANAGQEPPSLRRVGPSTLLRRYQDIDCSTVSTTPPQRTGFKEADHSSRIQSEPYTTPGSPVKLQRTLARSCIAKFIYCSRPLQELLQPDRSGDSPTYSTLPWFPLHFPPSSPNCACLSRTAPTPRRAMRHFIPAREYRVGPRFSNKRRVPCVQQNVSRPGDSRPLN